MNREKYYFHAPKLTQYDVWNKADQFRSSFAPSGTIPIDILHIVEFKLNIDIDPVESIKSKFDVDAILLNSLDRILIDKETYMNDRYENRLRFSLAHEIGHYELHQEIIKKFQPTSLEEWFDYMEYRDEYEYKRVELQAYEFAGRLLVPRNLLLTELRTIKPYVDEAKDKLSVELLNEEGLIEYVASAVCKKFGVSDQVIVRRIHKEQLWPIPD